jgi:hypothetical protein
MPHPIRPLTIDLEGKKVKVFRNLKHKNLFSVQYQGLVVAHLAKVQITGVSFHVAEGGRQRVISVRQRNVHAYAIGIFTAQEQPAATEPVSYNPYTAGYFYRVTDRSPIYSASSVVLRDGLAYATTTTTTHLLNF